MLPLQVVWGLVDLCYGNSGSSPSSLESTWSLFLSADCAQVCSMGIHSGAQAEGASNMQGKFFSRK
jgi:hypothetical protein